MMYSKMRKYLSPPSTSRSPKMHRTTPNKPIKQHQRSVQLQNQRKSRFSTRSKPIRTHPTHALNPTKSISTLLQHNTAPTPKLLPVSIPFRSFLASSIQESAPDQHDGKPNQDQVSTHGVTIAPKLDRDQLKLTLFTPTMSIADRLPVRSVRFQTLGDHTMSVFAKLNNSTYQIGPGRLFIVEEDPTHADNDEDWMDGIDNDDGNNGDQDVHNCNRDDSRSVLSASILPVSDPFSWSQSIPTPLRAAKKGFKHHLFFITGGVAVKRKDDLIISALQLINPHHIDPDKVNTMMRLMEMQSCEVSERYNFLRQLGNGISSTSATDSHQTDRMVVFGDQGDFDLSVGNNGTQRIPQPSFRVVVSPTGFTQVVTQIFDQEMTPATTLSTTLSTTQPSIKTTTTTTTQSFYHPAHPSIEYAVYDDRPYITSIVNDVAIALDTTLAQVEKIQSYEAQREY